MNQGSGRSGEGEHEMLLLTSHILQNSFDRYYIFVLRVIYGIYYFYM